MWSSALRQRRRSRTVADDVSLHGAVPSWNAWSSASAGDTGESCNRLIRGTVSKHTGIQGPDQMVMSFRHPGDPLTRGTVSKTAVLCSSVPTTATCLPLLSSRRSLTLVARRLPGVAISHRLLTYLVTLCVAAGCSCQEIIPIIVPATNTLYNALLLLLLVTSLVIRNLC